MRYNLTCCLPSSPVKSVGEALMTPLHMKSRKKALMVVMMTDCSYSSLWAVFQGLCAQPEVTILHLGGQT